MARKSAALLKSTPIKLSPLDKKFLAKAQQYTPDPAAKEQWNRYLAALEKDAEAEARLDVVYRQVEKEGGSSSAKSYPAFMEALRLKEREASSVFGALNAYEYAVKHKDDKVGVPEEEVRAIVIDSLSDKLDDLQFELNFGLLGAKVAQEIRKDTIEENAGDPPFCSDCKED
jgi:hypothetical protein